MASTLVGRMPERQVLQDMLNSKQAEFLALYGRRRVGKTFLIREFFKSQQVIFFNITGSKGGTVAEQINNFTQQLAEAFLSGIMPKVGPSWNEAFKTLTDIILATPKDKKIVLFFDELPWMAGRNSNLLQQLDYYWNQYWSDDKRLKLVICGSSASWIINKVINNRGGLHNRITRRMHLHPFNLHETASFLRHQGVKLNHRQVAQIYMAMGGVPYYLSHIEKHMTAAQAIEKLAFNKTGLLLTEFDNLFASLFDDYESYVAIVRAIAAKREGIGQRTLLEQLGKAYIGKGGLEKLAALEDAGFIMKFTPHSHSRRGSYYRVVDEYTLFYLQWIEPMRTTLQTQALQEGNWLALQNTPGWHNWQGYAFESVCYKHIGQIRKKLNMSPAAIADSWRYVPRAGSEEQGAQIDLLFDRPDDAITLCEIKFSQKPFTLDKATAQNLIRKRDVFSKRTKTQKQLFISLIAAHGLKNDFYADDLIDGVVTLDDLFAQV